MTLRRRSTRARRPNAGAASCCRRPGSTTTSVIWIDQLFGAEVVDAHGRATRRRGRRRGQSRERPPGARQRRAGAAHLRHQRRGERARSTSTCPTDSSNDAARRRADALSRRLTAATPTTSVLGRARERDVWELLVHDFRDATDDVHRSVDDTPFGGARAWCFAPSRSCAPSTRPRTCASGHRPDAVGRDASPTRWRRSSRALDGFTLLCGRYEGFDQRVLDLVVDDEISLGRLRARRGRTRGAVRHRGGGAPRARGALGNDESSVDESFSDGLLEYPHYTKPAPVRGLDVPEILRSGDHAAHRALAPRPGAARAPSSAAPT